jgi:FkbM family methyltransferase
MDAKNQFLASDAVFREAFLQTLRDAELRHGHPKSAVRDRSTGPLLDAAFLGCLFTKRLKCGLEFSFQHTGRISREFLLAETEPEYVWEPQTSKLLLHFAGRSKNVIVGGAYFGDQALLLAKEVLPRGGVVHAFEPTQEQHGRLLANAGSNQLTNLMPHRLGLWSVPGVRLAFDGADELAAPMESTSSEGDGGVYTTTVDACVKEHGLESLDLLMIDVEGGEYHVLQGAVEQLASAQAPVIIYETNSRYSDWTRGLENAETCVFLRERGYHLFAIRDFHANVNVAGMPVELTPADRTYITGPHHGFNMLAVKDLSLLSDPLFHIVNDVSPKLIPHKNDPKFEPVLKRQD